MELLEESSGMNIREKDETMRHCRKIIQMGSEAHMQSKKSVLLRTAIKTLLEKKSGMRERTLIEIRQVCRRFVEGTPELANMHVRSISTEQCQKAIDKAFTTDCTRLKAKRVLNSLFMHAKMSGWCDHNPVKAVVVPPHKEKTILALKIEEVLALLRHAEKAEHILCAPAVGIMLWAGIRPYEIERLRVAHLNFEDGVITVPAVHSKTGGARQVTMHPVLVHWLRKTITFRYAEARLVPGSWMRRWCNLRRDAGFEVWSPDVLRHTFASYHLKYFKNPQELQMEMGHSTPELLRTRYLAMENVTLKAAVMFWNYGLPRASRRIPQPGRGTPRPGELTDQNLSTP